MSGGRQRFRLDAASTADPQELLQQILRNGITQETSINDLEPPAFEVLPSLKKLKQRVSAAGRDRFQAVFMSGSGSTIVGIGDSEPPSFLYDEPEYADVFISDAKFLTRGEGEWYLPGMDFVMEAPEWRKDDQGEAKGVGIGSLDSLKLPFSFEA